MEEREVDVFELDSAGQIVYESVDGDESVSDNLFGIDEVENNGSDVIEDVVEGDSESDSLEDSETVSETEENVFFDSSDFDGFSLLSDEVSEVVVQSLSPASGTLASSTLDYFDRIVSGLPNGYRYIAYRTSDNSYDGVLYYGNDFTLYDNVITFDDDCIEMRVYRTSSSGTYNYTYAYSRNFADGASIAYDLNGETVYYTNASEGYPLLGGYKPGVSLSSFLVVGVLTACLSAVLSKLLLKR